MLVTWRGARSAPSGWTMLALLVVARLNPDLTGSMLTLAILAPAGTSWTIDAITDLLTKEN